MCLKKTNKKKKYPESKKLLKQTNKKRKITTKLDIKIEDKRRQTKIY